MPSVLTPLQWSIEDITISSHRGSRTVKTCMNDCVPRLVGSFEVVFGIFAATFVHDEESQKDFAMLLPGRGGRVHSVQMCWSWLHRSLCLHLRIPRVSVSQEYFRQILPKLHYY